jgi:hypothetical protein
MFRNRAVVIILKVGVLWGLLLSRNDGFDHLAGYIGQSKVSSVIPICQFFVIKAEQR